MTTDTKDRFTLKRRRIEGGTPPCEHWGVDSETGVLRDVLVGPIDHFTEILPTNSMNRKMLRDGVTLDVVAARDQYQAVLDIYRQADVTVHITPADADLPLQIWARDGSFMTPWGMIIGQMSQWWRRGEYGPVLDFCAANQIPIYDKVTAGCAEGGDFMMVTPDFAIMGCSGERSQRVGAEQMQRWLAGEGVELFIYEFDPHFVHADCTIVMLADKLAAAVTQVVDPALLARLAEKNIEVIDVSYSQAMQLGCNVMSLGNERVLLPSQNTDLIDACSANGLKVFAPDVSAITIVGGGIHCMSLALRRDKYGD
jgi:N-dimethylarginine dimethylaminohydrolase